MDNDTTLNAAAAQPAEAEKSQTGATGLGKFKDVAALLEAYEHLEAEFTRRSQRLKELEKASRETPPAQAASGEAPPQPPRTQSGETPACSPGISEEEKMNIISEYLEGVAKNRGVPLIAGGVQVSARRAAPATVREAGELAQQFLNKRR